jgi:putative membrane protein
MMKVLLAFACRHARWPTVIRRNSPFPIDQRERARLNLRAMRESITLLEEGRIVGIFPEGFPNVDRNPTPKKTDHDMLPFEPGFARLAQFAASRGVHAPMIPVGFHYERGARWTMTMRFGPPITFRERDKAGMIADAEHAIRALSTPP